MYLKIVSFYEVYAPEIVRIRTDVFVKEQNIDAALDFDGKDESVIQVLVFQDRNAIATARMLADGHIGRLAVLKAQRKKGAGSGALLALIAEAKQRQIKRVYLGAQLHAVAFYKNKGFKICSDVFMDAGIEHVEMELRLTHDTLINDT